jgi:hypothetical protein
MVDSKGLGRLGFAFAGITAAVMMIAALVVAGNLGSGSDIGRSPLRVAGALSVAVR